MVVAVIFAMQTRAIMWQNVVALSVSPRKESIIVKVWRFYSRTKDCQETWWKSGSVGCLLLLFYYVIKKKMTWIVKKSKKIFHYHSKICTYAHISHILKTLILCWVAPYVSKLVSSSGTVSIIVFNASQVF